MITPLMLLMTAPATVDMIMRTDNTMAKIVMDFLERTDNIF